MNTKSKRGVLQLDWVISLALFLLFIAFTFMIISPKTDVFIDEKAALNNIKYSFIEDYEFDASFLPIFIETQRRGIEPIIFPMQYNLTNVMLEDETPYSYLDSDLIFLSNITSDYTVKKLVSSSFGADKNYASNKMMLDFLNNVSLVSSQMLEVHYYKNDLKQIIYLDEARVKNFSIKKSTGEDIDFPNKKILNSSQSNVYVSKNNFFVFKQYTFYNLPRVYYYFNTSSEFDFSFNIYTYDKFYYPVQLGNLLLNETWCLNVTTDYFDFSNDENTITIKTEPTLISTCMDNKDYAKVTIRNPKYVEMHFSKNNLSENYNSTKDLSVFSGVLYKISGVSETLLNNLSNKTIEETRQRYFIPETIDFQVVMTDIDYTPIFSYGVPDPSKDKNVFIKRWHDYLIYENGTRKLVLMGAKVWQ